MMFLDSLFIGESTLKISEIFSTGWTGWEPIQHVLHVQPYFIKALSFFDRFSPIRAQN